MTFIILVIVIYFAIKILLPSNSPNVTNSSKTNGVSQTKKEESHSARKEATNQRTNPSLTEKNETRYFWNSTQGVKLWSEDKPAEALECLNIALSIRSDEDRLLYIKGSCLIDLERFDEALVSLDRYLSRVLDNPNALYWKGYCLCRLYRNKEAKIALEAARKLDPENQLTIELSAFVEAALSEAKTRYSENFERGVFLKDSGDYKTAIEKFDIALKFDSGKWEAYYNKGVCLAELGRHNEAVQAFENALAIDPSINEVFVRKEKASQDHIRNLYNDNS